MKYYLAIDIGASSGRHILGWAENGEIRTREVYRFPNGVTEENGHLTWDVEALEAHVRAGIATALQESVGRQRKARSHNRVRVIAEAPGRLISQRLPGLRFAS